MEEEDADHDLADFQRSCTSRGGVCAILNAAEPPPDTARPIARPSPMRELGGCERRVATTPLVTLSPSRNVVTTHLAVLSPCSRRVSGPFCCNSEDLRWSRPVESPKRIVLFIPVSGQPRGSGRGSAAGPSARGRSLWRARTCRPSGPRPICLPSTCSGVVVRSVYVSSNS